jgi:TPR repeat protein
MKKLTGPVYSFSLTCVMVIVLGVISGAVFAQGKDAAPQQRQGQQMQNPLAMKSKAEFDAVRQKAEAGDAQSQYRLSIAYSNGKYVKADDKKMVEWLRKAAEQGHTEAQFYLSGMYAKGVGVKQDYTEAANWMRKVADKGLDMAQFNLGNMYEMGLGVPKDQKQAIAWYRKSAAQGNPYAQKALETIRKGGGKQKDAAHR